MGLAHSPRIVTDGLVLCLDAANVKSYPGSGTTCNNLISGKHNGTLTNGPTFSTNKFYMDGVDDRISVDLTNNTTIRCYDSSIMFMVDLPVVSGGQRCILSFRSGSGGQLYIGKSSSAIFSYYDSLSATPAYTIGSISANTPFVCTVVCDSTNSLLKHYINGKLAGSATRTGWLSSYNATLNLGYDAGGTNEYMIGNFYGYYHYNKVLTDAEVRQNFNALRGRFGI